MHQTSMPSPPTNNLTQLLGPTPCSRARHHDRRTRCRLHRTSRGCGLHSVRCHRQRTRWAPRRLPLAEPPHSTARPAQQHSDEASADAISCQAYTRFRRHKALLAIAYDHSAVYIHICQNTQADRFLSSETLPRGGFPNPATRGETHHRFLPPGANNSSSHGVSSLVSSTSACRTAA